MTPGAKVAIFESGVLRSLSQIPGLQAYYDALIATSIIANTAGQTSFWADLTSNSQVMGLVQSPSSGNFASFTALTAFGTNDFTVSAKFQVSALAADQSLLGSLSTGFDINIRATTGKVQVAQTNIAFGTASNVAITAFQTVVVTYVRASGVGTYYFNGVADNSPADTVNYVVGVSKIGATATVPANFLGGSIYFTRVYSTALNAAAVLADANGTVQSNCVFDMDFTAQARGAASPLTSGTRGGASAISVTINASGATGARIGGARDLYQGTLANRMINLPWSGTNYGHLAGNLNGNYFSTPNSVALASITANSDWRAKDALVDWTPSSTATISAKYNTAGQRTFIWDVKTDGTVRFRASTDGTNLNITATSSVAPTVVDGTTLWLRVTRDSTSGDIIFYSSLDGTTWVQIGTTQNSTTGAMFWGTDVLEIGSNSAGTSSLLSGNAYYFDVRNAIVGTTTSATFPLTSAVKTSFNPGETTDGSLSWTSSTGEAWTVNVAGGNPALIVGRPGLLFDGSAFYAKTAPFSLAQPVTIVLVTSQIVWVINHNLIDGNAASTMQIYQESSTPGLGIYSGGAGTGTKVDLTLATSGIVTAQFNAAASFIQLNNGARTVFNIATSTPNGFTIGADATGANPAGIRVNAAAVFSGALSAAQIAQVVNFFARRWAINV